MRIFLAAGSFLAAASTTSLAEPLEALKPMSFLAGHCWRGDFPDGKQSDEHCFKWLFDGKALRDTHTVRNPGRPDYVGETTYYWDSVSRRIEYVYIENLGGISRGTVETAPNALVFPPAQYVEGGRAMTYRVRWSILNDQTYEAFSEAQGKEGWEPMFKIAMRRDG